MRLASTAIGFISPLILAATAASFPPTPIGVTVVNSTRFPGRSISFKEVSLHIHHPISGECPNNLEDKNLRDDEWRERL